MSAGMVHARALAFAVGYWVRPDREWSTWARAQARTWRRNRSRWWATLRGAGATVNATRRGWKALMAPPF